MEGQLSGYLRGLTRPLRYARGAAFVASLFVLAACSGKPEEKAAPTRQPAAVRSACEVLTAEDVSAFLGQTLKARPDPEDQGSSYSSCGYYPGEGPGVLYLTVYWQGGQEEWNTWQTATRYAGQTWEQIEKVDLNKITGACLVSGLGDRAYFGGIMPSLVLKGDILLEFKLALVTDEKRNFPMLAKSALARLPGAAL